jgi:hypothetical protein
MKKIIIFTLLTFSISANAQKIESHCAKSETTILTSKMGKMEKDKFIPNGKYLSFCSDAKKEPFTKFTYRYGKIGAIELEVVATPTSKFNLHHEMTGPRMSDNVVWFNKGNTTYLVNEAMGMASGVWVYVYQGKKKIAEISSGFGSENYYSDLGMIDMTKAKSPVFEIKNHGQQF